MAGIAWVNDELEFLRNNYLAMSCEEIAGRLARTMRSVQHKFGQLGLERPQPKVGDKINRLTIKELYQEYTGKQNRTIARVTCECNPDHVFDVRLTAIVQEKTRSCGCLKSEIQRERAIIRNTKHGQSINGNKLFITWCNQKFKYEFCDEWKDFLCFSKWANQKGYNENYHIKRYNQELAFSPDNCYIIHKKHHCDRLYKIWNGLFVRCYNKKFKQYCSYGGRGIRVCDEWWEYINFRNWSLKNGYAEDLSIDKIDNNFHYCPENCRWATLTEQVESKHNNRQILAFNEVKSILHWTKDSRCNASVDIIKHRLLQLGWSTEKSIETVEYLG